MNALQVIWFFLIGILLAGYAILDGFDLGVGLWYLFARKDEERRTLHNAIAPVWDGNEVWLLTGGGALFAAFPPVYAAVFSGLYLPLMLVLLGLIFRAVSIEFRSKLNSSRWRGAWDIAFACGSFLPALLFGVAIGNLLHGLRLDVEGNYAGTFFDLLNPYALLIGLLGLSMFAMHGALYIVLKTDGELAAQARQWAKIAWVVARILFLASALATVFFEPQLFANFTKWPALWVIPFLVLGLLISVGYFHKRERAGAAFLASALSFAGLLALTGASIFPNLVPIIGAHGFGLSIYNASSSQTTLTVMLILALIGMPLVIGYTIWIYRTFRGKVAAQGWY